MTQCTRLMQWSWSFFTANSSKLLHLLHHHQNSNYDNSLTTFIKIRCSAACLLLLLLLLQVCKQTSNRNPLLPKRLQAFPYLTDKLRGASAHSFLFDSLFCISFSLSIFFPTSTAAMRQSGSNIYKCWCCNVADLLQQPAQKYGN